MGPASAPSSGAENRATRRYGQSNGQGCGESRRYCPDGRGSRNPWRPESTNPHRWLRWLRKQHPQPNHSPWRVKALSPLPSTPISNTSITPVRSQKLLVGRHITRGLGAGGDPSTGRRCAEAGREMIRRIVTGADLVFIASGLGGGSGTGICPIVAEEAKAAGALVVGIVTTPFHVERRQRMARALEGLESLRRTADAVLVLDNNRLLHYVPHLPLDEAFSIMDQLVAEIVKGIVETITYHHSSTSISLTFVPSWPTAASP